MFYSLHFFYDDQYKVMYNPQVGKGKNKGWGKNDNTLNSFMFRPLLAKVNAFLLETSFSEGQLSILFSILLLGQEITKKGNIVLIR